MALHFRQEIFIELAIDYHPSIHPFIYSSIYLFIYLFIYLLLYLQYRRLIHQKPPVATNTLRLDLRRQSIAGILEGTFILRRSEINRGSEKIS